MNEHHHYCCVECLTPTPTLYRRYTTHASVKLTRCQTCGLDVDPYVEREAMLIAFDAILHRMPAYRHTLFNRDPFADFCLATSIGRSFKFVLGCSILDAYIKFEALRFRMYSSGLDATIFADDGGDDDPSVFAHLLAWSFLEQILVVLGTIVAVLPLLNHFRSTSSSESELPTRGYIISRLAMAVMLPNTFKAVTIFVHIWENSPTTRVLGALFVGSMQWMAVHCCMDRLMIWVDIRRSKGTDRFFPRKVLSLMPGYPLLGGFILRSFVPFVTGLLLGVPISMRQCSGVDLLFSFGDVGQQHICLP